MLLSFLPIHHLPSKVSNSFFVFQSTRSAGMPEGIGPMLTKNSQLSKGVRRGQSLMIHTDSTTLLSYQDNKFVAFLSTLEGVSKQLIIALLFQIMQLLFPFRTQRKQHFVSERKREGERIDLKKCLTWYICTTKTWEGKFFLPFFPTMQGGNATHHVFLGWTCMTRSV